MQELHFDEIFISVTPFLVELTSGHWDIFLEMIKITGKGGGWLKVEKMQRAG